MSTIAPIFVSLLRQEIARLLARAMRIFSFSTVHSFWNAFTTASATNSSGCKSTAKRYSFTWLPWPGRWRRSYPAERAPILVERRQIEERRHAFGLVKISQAY